MKKLIILFAFAISSSFVEAQDPTFTQFFSNPIYLNPALAGSSGCPRFAMNYRNEWPQLTGNYVTYSAAYDTYAKSISGGIGILAMHDQQGQGTISTSMHPRLLLTLIMNITNNEANFSLFSKLNVFL